MPVSHDYLADYRTLGCAPGCSMAELERAWRAALSRWHPDRVAEDRQAEAAQRTQSLNTAYRRLRGFAQQHGRLPGSASAGADEGTPASTINTDAPPSPPQRRRGRRRLAAAAIAATLILSWVLHTPETPEIATSSAEEAFHAAASAPGPVFGLDSHADEVLEAAGAPVLRQGDERSGETWEYGPSFVSFRARRVVDWYSSPMRPLPVASERPQIEAGAALTAPPSRR